MLKLERLDEEIDNVLNQTAKSFDKGKSKFPGMTYEEGVEAAIRWVTGESNDNPMED